MNRSFPALPSLPLPTAQIIQGRRVFLESAVATTIGISVATLRQVTAHHFECFPGSSSFSLSPWEVQQQWPELYDEDEERLKSTNVYTETGAAVAVVLLRDRIPPEQVTALLRAFAPPPLEVDF